MAQTTSANIRPVDVVQTLVRRPLPWVVPTVVVTALAIVYALVRVPSWEAAQALILRDEAGGSLSRPGKFNHVEEMKTAQETLLELAKSRSVLSGALSEVGPPAETQGKEWPSAKDIESLQSVLKLTPPKGAEFGKTEVFYLKVKDKSRDRAEALAAAVCRQLQTRFEELRELRARSVTNELIKTVSLAKADLARSTEALSAMEREVGSDLAELRILSELPSGDSDLRRTLTELESELRAQRAAQNANQELLQLLLTAKVDPGHLLASPSRLLESQPALKKLKDGLLDAQLRTAQLLGTMSESHPQVQAAKAAEQEVSLHLHHELAIAIKGLEVDCRLTNDRVTVLEAQRASVQERLQRLAGLRAEYSNLAATAKHRSEILKTAEQELSEARASQAAAHTASLISLIDQPDAGNRPADLSRSAIVLAGLGGGLLLGLAGVFLTVQPGVVPAAAPVEASTVAPAATGVAPVAVREPVAGFGAIQPGTLSFKQALQKLATAPAGYN